MNPAPFCIFDALRAFSARTAVICGEQSLTFLELDLWANAVKENIPPTGTTQERCIGILAPSSAEYVTALLAVWKTQSIAVPLQPQHPLSELKYIVEDSSLQAVLVHPECMTQAEELVLNCPRKNIQLVPIQSPLTAALHTHIISDPPPLSDERGALMIYTSGTTSHPKGVVITLQNLDFQIRTLQKAWGWTHEDRIINVLPLHHVHGVVNILLSSLASGACCELFSRFEAGQTWERLASGEVTVFMAVPTIYSKLVQNWEKMPAEVQKQKCRIVAKLRLMVSGSAALPLPLFERWKDITGHVLLERYGMTEIGMALSNPYNGERKPKSVGKPLPGVNVRLVNDEIQIKGPNVFREYQGKPEFTQKAFTSDGWFLTGDQARVDDEGYYFILGRTSQDIMKCGGYKISALEIEGALLEHPDLHEVAVLGTPDPEWGEKVAAFCVWKNAVIASEHDCDQYQSIKKWLQNQLAHYKIPSLWKSMETLPRNAMGKVTKSVLRDSLA